ncbi:unnamed protein product [Alternaria alternata]
MRSNTIFILANLFLPILTAPLPVTGVIQRDVNVISVSPIADPIPARSSDDVLIGSELEGAVEVRAELVDRARTGTGGHSNGRRDAALEERARVGTGGHSNGRRDTILEEPARVGTSGHSNGRRGAVLEERARVGTGGHSGGRRDTTLEKRARVTTGGHSNGRGVDVARGA